MAEVRIMVGGRQYAVHCRDGEEAHLHQLASMMSDRVNQVKNGSQGLTEVRQLLFAGLLLADSLSEQATAAPAPVAAPPPAPVPAAEPEDETDTLAALARLAERIEALGDGLAAQLASA